jgi:uncharacterized protein (PEP-CTERM system associated)
VTATVRNGPEFSRFSWELTSTNSLDYRGNSDLSRRSTNTASSEYAINRFVAARDSIGYEKIKQSDFEGSLDGLTWSVGTRLTPGPRTQLVVDFGQRFGEYVWSANASYNAGESALITFTYAEDIETDQQALDRNLQGLTTSATGEIIDPVTGLPTDPNFGVTDLIDQTARTKNANLTVTGTFQQRNHYVAQVRLLSREFSSTNPGQINGDEETISYSLSLLHDVNPKTTARASARYSDTLQERTAGTGGQTLTAGVGLTYKFNEDLLGEVRYDFRDHEISGGDGTVENAAMVRLRKQF